MHPAGVIPWVQVIRWVCCAHWVQVIRWVIEHPGQPGQRQPRPGGGRAGDRPVTLAKGSRTFLFFCSGTQKHVSHEFPGPCQNAITPVRCTALWTQIDLNP